VVDATLIASASIKTDEEARWAGHRRKKPVHGYKAHVATDEEAGLVRSVEITTANIHDGTMLEACCRTILVMFTGTAPTRQAALQT
jgi:IS5 family transposase